VFDTIAALDAAFIGWHAIRLTQVHRTHGEVIGVRAARDRAALGRLPTAPFLVTDAHLRRVGKDCLVSFEASLYSVPAKQIRAGKRVELRVAAAQITIHALDGTLLASHVRASVRGSWVIDPSHYDGLPDGHTRATVIEFPHRDTTSTAPSSPGVADRPLAALLAAHRAAATPVARRPCPTTPPQRRPGADHDHPRHRPHRHHHHQP
jgi:hypothetical protein